MAEYLHGQTLFTGGELAPSMYARIDVERYYKGLKVAKNVLPIPQGGARKRFGTVFNATLPVTDYNQIYPIVFEYLDECVYQVIFYNDNIAIYLEKSLVATVTSTGIDGNDVNLIDETILESALSITVGFQAPYYLTRAAGTPNAITAVDTTFNFFSLTTANLVINQVLPVQFTTTGSLPTTVPQIKLGRTYFTRGLSTSVASLYLTATDAANDINRIVFTALGSLSSMVPLNTWTFAAVTFKNLPVYDFDGGYDALTFTPGATVGSTTLTASGPIFTMAMIGGIFAGGGGIARITAYSSTTVVTILVIDDFTSTSAIPGSLSLLTEPAWSDARGWPKVNGSYQNRAIYANTDSLPNGLWFSVSNDYIDFDDSSLDADQAISWYPTSHVGSTILYITPYRSLVIHTDAGVYSTPFQADVAITPLNFSLTLQDSTPPSGIQPVTIDNQLVIVSGRDVNAIIWEFGQGAYVPYLISAISEHLITTPYWMSAFRDRSTAGGRYVFISNRNGVLAMYQTLITDEIAGWTWAITEQSYGNSYFRQSIASVLGRAWFIVEREQAVAQTPIAITNASSVNNTLTAAGSSFDTVNPTAVLFATSGSLPTTVPQINATTYYYAIGVDMDTFKIYATQADALSNTNVIAITNFGVSSTVIPYILNVILNLEELSYDVNTDCAIVEKGTNLTQATGLSIFNGQTVTVKGDGLTWDSNPVLGGIEQITNYGAQGSVSKVEIGFPVKYAIVPLPISIPMNGPLTTGNIAQAKHIRYVDIMFTDTVGGKVNNQNIALNYLNNQVFQPPIGQTGIMEVSLLAGWNQFKSPPFVITQEQPYDFNLIGLFYRIEV